MLTLTESQPVPFDQQGRAGRIKLADCRRAEPSFTGLLYDVAIRSGTEPRALSTRTLLHLPRVATPGGSLSVWQVQRELNISAERLKKDQRAVRALTPERKHALSELIFQELADEPAQAVFSSLHYLRSARPGAVNYALLDPVDGRPVSLCSVSPLEWKRVAARAAMRVGVGPERVWDVSRVYSFDVAPPNAISFLLARVRSAMRHDNVADLLTTAVDQNLGFSGASYRAANWQRWMSVQARPYLYLNGRYASPRQLRQEFGTSNLAVLQRTDKGLFEQSRTRLLDPVIFCCRLRGVTESVPDAEQLPLRR